MESPGWMLAAVNLYEEEGRIWYFDEMPENIELYEANEEETLWGLAYYLDYYYTDNEEYRGVHPLIAFINQECPKNAGNSWGAEALCEDMLTRVPDLFDKAEWTGIKHTLSQLIMQTSGLQYDCFRIEYYYFLIGVIMIAEMRQEMAAQEQKISSLESRLSASISDFNRRYEALLHSFEALVKVSITFDEIKNGLKELSRTTAEGVLEKLSITLADNKRFMDELPKLREFVKENDKPSEVHNHFEKESGCQVFNGPVSGQFNKKQ
jgi:hypothetical protein